AWSAFRHVEAIYIGLSPCLKLVVGRFVVTVKDFGHGSAPFDANQCPANSCKQDLSASLPLMSPGQHFSSPCRTMDSPKISDEPPAAPPNHGPRGGRDRAAPP